MEPCEVQVEEAETTAFLREGSTDTRSPSKVKRNIFREMSELIGTLPVRG